MTNPFLPYLSEYGPGAVPDRPWWRRVHADNLASPVARRGGLTIGVWNRGAPHAFPQRREGAQDWGFTIGDTFHPWPPEPWPAGKDNPITLLQDLMARLDAENPLPIPPPTAGQVWAWPDGTQHLIGKVGADGMALAANGSGYPPDCWPPAGAVLILGFGAPWASAGWAP